MTFETDRWIRLPENELSTGNKDQGGIWCALKLSGARTLSKYMLDKYGVKTRIFMAAVDDPLYANSYRVKSQGVMLLGEIIN